MLNDVEIRMRQVAAKIGIVINEKQINSIVSFLFLLKKWNKTYKMTAITDWREMLIKHVFDSMSVIHFIKGNQIIDVGSGGGVPGIILAILLPEKEFLLIDSIGKKVCFLNHVKNTLNLSNVAAIKARVEAYYPKVTYDTVISRAFSSIYNFQRLSKHLLSKDGQMIAMKGSDVEKDTLVSLDLKYEIFAIDVPFLEARRNIIRMWDFC